MIVRIYLKFFSMVRSLLWCLFTDFSSKLGSTVGPYSIARISKSGKFICHGVLHARDSFKLNIEGGEVCIDGNVFFNSAVSLSSISNIKIGKGCIFGENVKIYDHDHDISNNSQVMSSGFVSQSVVIGNNVWIGSNVVILKGVNIGDDAVIGANTTVLNDVKAGVVFHERKSFLSKNREFNNER